MGIVVEVKIIFFFYIAGIHATQYNCISNLSQASYKDWTKAFILKFSLNYFYMTFICFIFICAGKFLFRLRLNILDQN